MNIELEDYNPNWPKIYLIEKEKLQDILVQDLITIHHIGSTAIPNIKAKPIIDILCVVKNIKDIDRYHSAMERLGYEGLGENGISSRRFFLKRNKNTQKRTHHVHIFDQSAYGQIERHLDFRDYLRENPKEARNYEVLKEKLAQRYPENRDKYTEGKEAFIKEIERKANIYFN
ncbi:GrpB family protein [Staphylococcus auricularis]|uniref:GrpB family protein n=1 Tax=Staphylococcus auricularis TaxID=29379 RepID=UPI00242C9042|nr:GrpB family protein [Staphylococcus auricularis]